MAPVRLAGSRTAESTMDVPYRHPSATAAAFTALAALPPVAPRICCAEDFSAKDVLGDAKLHFTSPVRWDGSDRLTFVVRLAHANGTFPFRPNRVAAAD